MLSPARANFKLIVREEDFSQLTWSFATYLVAKTTIPSQFKCPFKQLLQDNNTAVLISSFYLCTEALLPFQSQCDLVDFQWTLSVMTTVTQVSACIMQAAVISAVSSVLQCHLLCCMTDVDKLNSSIKKELL